MFSFSLLMSVALPAWAGDLKVTIEGVRSDAGTIMIGLYDNLAGFDAAIKRSTIAGLLNDSERLVGVALRAATGTQSIVFTQLHPGKFALIIFHDENDNGWLDTNFWGVPTEGYGFSNNAQGFLGAPSFAESSVTIDGEDTSISISLIYPRAFVAFSADDGESGDRDGDGETKHADADFGISVHARTDGD